MSELSLNLKAPKIPGWLPELVMEVMEIAERLWQGQQGAGQSKKEWVIATCKTAARKHDIKAIPDFIENPLEDVVIAVVVEVVWALAFKKRADTIQADPEPLGTKLVVVPAGVKTIERNRPLMATAWRESDVGFETAALARAVRE